MDEVGWSALGLFLFFLLLAALITAGKQALSYLSSTSTRDSSEQVKQESGSLAWLLQKPTQVSLALSFCRSVFIIVATCLGIAVAIDIFSLNWGAIVVTIVILMVCYTAVWTTARKIAKHNPDSTASSLSGLLMVLAGLCWPVVKSSKKSEQAKNFDVFELETPGPLEADQHEMIKSIVDMRQTTAREIMVPRVDIIAVEKNTPINELVDLIVKEGYSRIPIYQDSIDNIVGVVNARDLLTLYKEGRQSNNWDQLIHPAYFIPESKKIDDLLREFKEKKITQAMVVDEFGGIAGLVSMKDVLEEIVGEISGEFDTNQPQIDRVSPTEAILDAKVSIDALNEDFRVKIESEGFDTVGGLVLHHLGRMAAAGDEVKVNGLLLSVISTIGRRIQRIKVTRLETPENKPEDSTQS